MADSKTTCTLLPKCNVSTNSKQKWKQTLRLRSTGWKSSLNQERSKARLTPKSLPPGSEKYSFFSTLHFCLLTSQAKVSWRVSNFKWAPGNLYLYLFFQGVCESAQGFVNFLLFCLFTEKFQVNLRRVIHIYCPCFDGLVYIPEQSFISEDSPYGAECSEMNETSSLFRTSDFSVNYRTTSY